MPSFKNILVVGAGFAGACYARDLAEAGHRVTVIDQRPHIAGNAYDEVSAEGVRLHRYGPHLFHTNNASVVEWVSRFGATVPYEHTVQALVPPDNLVPLPVNRATINAVFGVTLGDEAAVAQFLRDQSEPIAEPGNAGEYLRSQIGSTLTDLFFRPYTKKMWALDLEEMDAAVVKRLPIRFDDERRYFPDDRFQFLFRDGYTALFDNIFSHERIEVHLSRPFEKDMLKDYDACFSSMPIDEYFGFVYGPLPYRSIKFHHRAATSDPKLSASVLNFTDTGPFTRETDWSRLPCHRAVETGLTTITTEEPCDYVDNNHERYYPVKTSDGRYDEIYKRYKALADETGECFFIGRCGTYRYLNMDQVINQSRIGAQRWIAQAA